MRIIEMQEIIVIADTIKAKDGHVIVAGTNHRFDEMPDEQIKRLIGNQVKISGKKYQVEGVETSRSIVGSKNIFIKLADTIKNMYLFNGKILSV
jgi:CxxC motif-containing protein